MVSDCPGLFVCSVFPKRIKIAPVQFQLFLRFLAKPGRRSEESIAVRALERLVRKRRGGCVWGGSASHETDNCGIFIFLFWRRVATDHAPLIFDMCVCFLAFSPPSARVLRITREEDEARP